MNSRDSVPDFVKGIAIVLMVYGHIERVGLYAPVQQAAVDFIYTFHMPLFLILSGFFFRPKDELSESFRKIFSRLLRPYLIFAGLYLFGLMLVQRAGVHTSNLPPASISDFVFTLLLRPRGAYWFLHSLVVVQLAYLSVLWVKQKVDLSSSMLVVLYLVLLALACLAGLINERTVVYFLVGMVCAFSWRLLPESWLACWGCVAILLWRPEALYSLSIQQVAWVCLLLAALLWMGRQLSGSLTFGVLAWMGRNSILVLALHALFVVGLKGFAGPLLRIEPSGIIYPFMVLILTLAGCLVTGALMDRLKVSGLLFGNKTVYSPRCLPESQGV